MSNRGPDLNNRVPHLYFVTLTTANVASDWEDFSRSLRAYVHVDVFLYFRVFCRF